MATNQKAPAQQKPTKEMIQLVLNSISTAELEQFRLEKLAASLEPLKLEYVELTNKLKTTHDSILAIDPTWEVPKAPTLAERILGFVTDSDREVTKEEIVTAVGTKLIFSAMKKLTDKDKTLTLKNGKYSVTTA